MLNKKLMMLAIFIISLLAITAVSAADNATDDIVGVEANDDVVSVENANEVISTSESDNEISSANNTESVADVGKTNDEVLSVENDQVILGNESDVGTFDELSSLIENTSEGATLELDKDYKYVNGSTDGISISKAITIDGQGHVIDGSYASRIFYVTSDNVVLKNIKFINGKAISNAGAIFWDGSNGNINNSTFENCSVVKSYKTENTAGGAIYFYPNSVNYSLNKCKFINNSAVRGGAVEVSSNNGFIVDCIFENNNNAEISDSHGGALELNYGDYGSIINCTFINNAAEYGAAINLYYSDYGSIIDCTFVNNYALERGNAIIYCFSYDGKIDNCNFTNNLEYFYNEMILWDVASGCINNSYFSPDSGNIVSYNSEYDIVKRYSKLNCIDIIFYYRNATKFSAILDITNVNNKSINYLLIKDDMSVSFNSKTDDEGISYIFNELNNLSVGTWNVTVIFEGNDNYYPCNATATITVLPSSSSLTVDDVSATWDQETNLTANLMSDDKIVNEGIVSFYIGDKFIGNASVINGTAILTYESGYAGEFTITAIYNADNYLSSNNTGKLFVDTGDMQVDDVNSIGTFKALADLIENTPEGSVLNLTKDYIYISGSTDGIFINNPITIDGQGHTIDGNHLSRIFNINADNVVLNNIMLINAKMEDDGSAVKWIGSNGLIRNCSFINNGVNSVSYQDFKGGAIYWSGSHGSIISSNFKNNLIYSYYNKGGAIYWDGFNGTIINCSFVNNSAINNDGGAIFVHGSNCFINNCSFINNSARNGGAIITEGDNGIIINSTFYDNYVICNNGVDIEGSAIYFACKNQKIVNCIFTNNSCYYDKHSTPYGNSVIQVWYAKYYSIINCTFDNYVQDIYGEEADDGLIANSTFINNYNYIKFIQLLRTYDVTIDACNFITNIADKCSIHLEGSGIIIKSNFSNDFDNFYVNGDIKIIKKDSSLLLNNSAVINYGNNSMFTLFLSNEYGNLLINQQISCIISNENISHSYIFFTNDYGELLIPDLLNIGVWNVTVIFEGNDNYASCNATATITVLPPSTSLTIDDVNATVGHVVSLIANVNSTLTVNEGIVSFFDGENSIGQANVINGVATLSYTPTTAGEHNIAAVFSSDNYLSSNNTAKLLVDSATVNVLVNAGTVGFNSTFVAEVRGLYSTINEGTVTFYINDEYLDSVPVVNGSASINYVPLTAKSYTVKAVFGDSDKFLNDDNSTSYTVVPAGSSVAIGDMNGTVGHDIIITVGIISSNNLTINEGYVTFFDGSTQIGQSNVNNGVATLTYTPTTAGEHTITAVYDSDNYQSSNSTAKLLVDKANTNLNIPSISAVYFSNPTTITVNVKSNNKAVNEGRIDFYVNDILVGTAGVYDGVASFDYVADATGSLTVRAVYNETGNYFASDATSSFQVNKMPTTLTGESVIFDEQDYKTFTTELKNNNSNGVSGQTVKIEAIKYSGESKTFTGISDANGVTIYDVGNLAGGMWYVMGTYNGNKNYISSSFADKFIVVRMDTTTEIEEINEPHVDHTYRLKANIHDENGKLVDEGIVQFYLDGVDIGSIDLSQNNGHQSSLSKGVLGAANPMYEDKLGANDVSDLYLNYVPKVAGKHTLTAVYEGTTVYKSSNSTTTFEVKQGAISTKITSSVSKLTVIYNNGRTIVATLKDINGIPIKGVKLTVKVGTVTKTASTNAKGQASFDISTAVPKTTYYSATVKFAGNTKYKASSATVKVLIKKDNTKIVASNKAFKVKATKKVTAILKDSKNRVIKNRYVTFKVAGKSYKVKTNSIGVATATVKIAKKGSFATAVSFAGDKYYNKCSRAIKITVK